MKPGIFRDDIIDDYKKEFDKIYEDIAYKYPDIIQYVDIHDKKNIKINSKDFKLREQDMAYLQHYGLRTTLIDITENPFIAMLFLISNRDSFYRATLDMYNVETKKHSNNNLFSRVKMLTKNKRIIAQKGAFFNFEKLLFFLNDNQKKDIEKIPLVRLKLNYEFTFINKISEDIKVKEMNLEKLKEDYNKLDEQYNNKEVKVDKYINLLEESDKLYNENLKKARKNLNELKNINKERNKIAIQVNQCKNEIQLLKEKRNNQYKSFEDYILPKIRDEIRDKLEQYHYIENDLFPDIYKHLSYVQNNFIQSNKNSSFKKENNLSNISKLL